MRFWVEVFTRYSQSDVVIHDRRHPARVYDVVRDADRDPELLDRRVAAVVARLAAEHPSALGREHLHLQRGLREAFALSLAGERYYRRIVRAALEAEGLPASLSALPLIESSYRPGARSAAGAVGLWQFTAGTARRYLRIAADVDERCDPVRASAAAARHLRELREALPSWPLALTAYNHGLAGVERGRAALGSDDVVTLVRRYRGPRFGFESRNYYAKFLAARQVVADVGTYFPDLQPGRVLEYRVKRGDTLFGVARRHGVSVPSLRNVNGLRGARILPGQRLLIHL